MKRIKANINDMFYTYLAKGAFKKIEVYLLILYSSGCK